MHYPEGLDERSEASISNDGRKTSNACNTMRNVCIKLNTKDGEMVPHTLTAESMVESYFAYHHDDAKG